MSYPDHPLLFKAPDVLAVHEGRLTAYFVYARRESYVAPSARSRVLLSRLALPPRTSIVLSIEDTSHLDKLAEYAPLHDAILDIGSHARDRTPSGRIRHDFGAELVEELRPFHANRFAEAWVLTVDPDARRVARPARPGRSTADYNRLRRGEQLSDRLAGVGDMQEMSATGESPRVSQRPITSPALDRVAIEATELDYYIDRRGDGIVEVAAMLRGNDAHLAIRENLQAIPPRTGFDRSKPARAAAFAGIATLPEVSQ